MKKFAFIFLLLIFSCSLRKEYDVEIFCPEAGGRKVLVANTNIKEVVASAQKNLKQNIREETKATNFTIIRTGTGATVPIYGLSPQQVLRCIMTERQKGDIGGFVLQS